MENDDNIISIHTGEVTRNGSRGNDTCRGERGYPYLRKCDNVYFSKESTSGHFVKQEYCTDRTTRIGDVSTFSRPSSLLPSKEDLNVLGRDTFVRLVYAPYKRSEEPTGEDTLEVGFSFYFTLLVRGHKNRTQKTLSGKRDTNPDTRSSLGKPVRMSIISQSLYFDSLYSLWSSEG